MNKWTSSLKQVRFINIQYFCATFSVPSSDQKRMIEASAHIEDVKHLFKPNMRKRTEFFGIFLHELGSKVSGNYASVLEYELSFYSMLEITWSKYVNLLLPPPYETDCRNYSLSGMDSQADCFESCFAQHTLAKYTRFPLFAVPAHQALHVPTMLKATNLTDDLIPECKKSCQQNDCSRHFYSLNKMAAAPKERSILFEFRLQKSRQPMFIVKTEAANELITFVTNILGVIFFWTGLCPLTFFFSERVVNIVKKMQRNKELCNQLYRSFVIIMCVVLYLIQVFGTVSTYFAFITKVETKLMTEDQVTDIPVIDLCISEEVQAMSLNTSVERYFVVLESVFDYNIMDGKIMTQANKTELSIAQYLVHESLCLSTAFKVSNRSNRHDLRNVNLTSYGRFRENHNNMFIRQKRHPVRKLSPVYSAYTSQLLSMKLGFEFRKRLIRSKSVLKILMHDRSVEGYDADTNVIPLCQKNGSYCVDLQHIVTYQKVVQKLLKPPYDTKCLDAESSIMKMYSSSRNCINDCVAREFRWRHGKFHPTSVPHILRGDESSDLRRRLPDDEDKKQELWCKSLCGQRCLHTNYFAKLKSHFRSPYHLTIMLMTPTEPTVIVTTKAVVPFLDLLYVLLNGACFWLCFSPIDHALSQRILTRIERRRVAPISSQPMFMRVAAGEMSRRLQTRPITMTRHLSGSKRRLKSAPLLRTT